MIGVATLVSAVACIVASTFATPGAPGLAVVIFKPLTTALVIVAAARNVNGTSGRWIVGGLGASLVGDVLLLWPAQFFVFGLAAFLVAHLAYGTALWRLRQSATGPARLFLPTIAVAVVGALVLVGLWSGIPSALRFPVVLYFVALGSMATLATALASQQRGARARWCWVGGWFFVISDGLLAQNMFGEPLPTMLRPVAILGTYWLAQWGIAAGFVRAESPIGLGISRA